MWKTKNQRWKKLDNAAKIFPSIAHAEDPEIFRLSCDLSEEIDPDALTRALDTSLEEFPAFTDTIRRGVFWYYLERTGIRPVVEEEHMHPLSPLYTDDGGPLFRVTYYRRRISLELFHALTDGTGALVFFKNLVENYLAEAYPGTYEK
ncbi:MAG: hypothetical protein J6V24_05105, partial [Clostridia bacterium]|nr:hypothetical protein [Clostridia bacterium]